MGKFTYYKRVVNGTTKELHYQEECKDYYKGKSYPENLDSFNENELVELELDEWLDEGLYTGIFNRDDFKPSLSSS